MKPIVRTEYDKGSGLHHFTVELWVPQAELARKRFIDVLESELAEREMECEKYDRYAEYREDFDIDESVRLHGERIKAQHALRVQYHAQHEWLKASGIPDGLFYMVEYEGRQE
jgi:hypothetical protein